MSSQIADVVRRLLDPKDSLSFFSPTLKDDLLRLKSMAFLQKQAVRLIGYGRINYLNEL